MDINERIEKAKEVLAGCSGWPEDRCITGKRMYLSRKEAMKQKRDREVKVRYSKRHIRFDPYHCKDCDWWHLATREC